MSTFPTGNPNTGAFRDLPPGPHAGVETDPNAHVASDAMDRCAQAALILGLLSLILNVVTGVPAIWFGRRALQRIDAGTGKGRWAAWTGIGLGILSVVVFGVWLYARTTA